VKFFRREGIYSSMLTGWRKEREAAVDAAFSQKRGPEPKHNPLAGENKKLRRRNQRLEEELRKAELIIEVPQKTATAAGTAAGAAAGQRELLMAAVEELSSLIGVRRACQNLCTPRSSVYRRRRRRLSPAPALRSAARRLKAEEKSIVWRFYMKSAFKDCSPAQLCSSLLDDGQYHDPLEIASNRQG
jgi:hypothetical protein